jgi:hypothetical protein
MEMEALRDGNPLIVRVNFLDGKYAFLRVMARTHKHVFDAHKRASL